VHLNNGGYYVGITIKEIAKLCGVSTGTVDRAINNRTGISDKTKARILSVAEQMDYRPDYMAQSLARGRTMTIGVVLFDLYNRLFAQLLNAIESEARQQGYYIDVVLTDKQPDTELSCLAHLVSRKVDGIILFSVNQGQKFHNYLTSLALPIVTICNRIPDGNWPYIGIDDRAAMKEATRFVLTKGYERIIFVCPPLAYRGIRNIHTQEERLAGYLEAIEPFKSEVEITIIQQRDYIASMSELHLEQKRAAIMCTCDIHALEVLHYVQEVRGLRVPEDVGVMGFDDIDVLKYVKPQLATVEYNVQEMGKMAVESLLSQLNGNESQQQPLVSYSLVAGQSI
jgi:LacI family transcriptional regulator